MTKNDNDIHRDPQVVADQLIRKVRQHFVRISQNATDDKIPRPKEFRNFGFKNSSGATNI